MRIAITAAALLFAATVGAAVDMSGRGASVQAEFAARVSGMGGLTPMQISEELVALQMKVEKLYQMHGIDAPAGFDGKFEAED